MAVRAIYGNIMSYASFKNQWLGKRVDYDGVYGYQCVDLIKQYMAQEFGLKPGAWGNAIDYWTKTNPAILTKFDKVASTNAVQGDVVVMYGNSGNVYGHIGIAESQTSTTVTILEQNGSTGNGSGTGGDAIRTRAIAKSRIAGLLRPKGNGDIMDTDAKVKAQYYTLRGSEGTVTERKGWIGRSYAEFNATAIPEVKGRTAELNNLRSAVASVTKERDTARAQVATLTGQLLAERDRIKVLEAQVTTKDAELAGAKEAYDKLLAGHNAQIDELNKVIEIKDNEIQRLNKELANCDGESLTWSQHLILGVKGFLAALNPLNKGE